MYALCHGAATSAATHVPSGLQGNIRTLAVADNATCVIAASEDRRVTCWGSGIPSPVNGILPNTQCGPNGVPEDIFLWTVNSTGLLEGAVQCSDNSLHSWSTGNPTLSQFASNIQSASSAPRNFCWVSADDTASCTEFSGALGGTGQAVNVWAGDYGACIQKAGGGYSVSCYGSYSGLGYSSNLSITNAELSGPLACFQNSQGWFCSNTQANYPLATNLAQLWANKDKYPSTITSLETLSHWTEFADAGVLCMKYTDSGTKDSTIWCNGTGFSGNGESDLTDAVFQINAMDTSDVKQVHVAPSHVCLVLDSKGNVLLWIVVIAFIAFFALVLYLGIRNFRVERKLKSFRLLP